MAIAARAPDPSVALNLGPAPPPPRYGAGTPPATMPTMLRYLDSDQDHQGQNLAGYQITPYRIDLRRCRRFGGRNIRPGDATPGRGACPPSLRQAGQGPVCPAADRYARRGPAAGKRSRSVGACKLDVLSPALAGWSPWLAGSRSPRRLPAVRRAGPVGRCPSRAGVPPGAGVTGLGETAISDDADHAEYLWCGRRESNAQATRFGRARSSSCHHARLVRRQGLGPRTC
jgi:hypothetical protein